MTKGRGQATRALDVDVIESIDAAEAMTAEWTSLADEVGGGPFSLPSFALAWWRHLGKGRLRLVTVRDGSGELAGVAPLHARKVAGIEVVRWLGHGLGTTGELLVRPGKADIASVLWQGARETKRTCLQLTEFRHGGAGLAELRRSDDWAFHGELRGLCPLIDLTGAGSADDVLAVPERRGVRKKLARTDRSLAAEGTELRIDVAESPEEVHRLLDAVDSIYDSAEADRPRLHMLRGSYRPFLIDAMVSAASADQAALLVARLDDTPIAFDLYTRAAKTASAWLGRFTPDAAEWSPGHLLLRAGVDWAIKTGLDTIDLQLGDDEYKLRWASGSYDTLAVTAAQNPNALRRARSVLGAVDTAYTIRASVRS